MGFWASKGSQPFEKNDGSNTYLVKKKKLEKPTHMLRDPATAAHRSRLVEMNLRGRLQTAAEELGDYMQWYKHLTGKTITLDVKVSNSDDIVKAKTEVLLVYGEPEKDEQKSNETKSEDSGEPERKKPKSCVAEPRLRTVRLPNAETV